jgi:DNA-binding NarL/FixJ family response regulator
MASIPVSVTDNLDQPHEGGSNGQFIRVIVADTQAIFRAGLRKIFALEDDIRVVGQAETLAQTLAAAKKFSADILIFEAALTPNPLESVSDLLRQAPQMKMVVVTHEPNEELTLELFRRGAHGIVSREVEPETLVECLRKVSQGEPWLDRQGVSWVLSAYRNQSSRPTGSRPKVQLTPKESLIGHHRTGGEELSAQGLRQARRRRPPRVGTVLPESPRGRKREESLRRRIERTREWRRFTGRANPGRDRIPEQTLLNSGGPSCV